MAVRSREELLSIIQALVGEAPSDDALTLIEDFTDTFSDMEGRASDTTDWHKMYDENDAAWRKRYAERFSGSPAPDTPEPIEDEPELKNLTYENLFKEG